MENSGGNCRIDMNDRFVSYIFFKLIPERQTNELVPDADHTLSPSFYCPSSLWTSAVHALLSPEPQVKRPETKDDLSVRT